MPVLAAADVAVCRALSPAILISLKVFHCPQAGHLPIHLGDSCPQFSQTYAVLSFAIVMCFMAQNYE
jgi:predicted RNA-binding Zn-ribbon protein involved in translation (DUF1610 family)